MIKNLIAFAGLSLGAWGVAAAQLERLDVAYDADIYSVYVVMDIQAPAAAVRKILTDYEQLSRLNKSITSSRIIDSERSDTTRVLTRIKNCVLFFCLDVEKIEDVKEDSNGRIVVNIVPDSSDFRSGQAMWEVQSTAYGSRVIHYARLEPDVWVPSWLGYAVIKNTIRQEIQESFATLECLSLANCEQTPLVTNKMEPEGGFNDSQAGSHEMVAWEY